MTFREAVADAERRLLAASFDARHARIDVEVLARHVLGWDRATWLTRADQPASDAFLGSYARLIDRRLLREPVAYIVGHREFYGRDFEVSPAVLIPRPETELIVDWVLHSVPADPPQRIVDVGTGSGVLAVTLAVERPGWRVEAVDVSADAVAAARENARRHGADGRITFHVGDLLAPTHGAFDGIVANPPYVARRDAPGLSPDVRDHEPHVALFGGVDGLDVPRRLLGEAMARLGSQGWLAMEFGYGQRDVIEAAARHAGLQVVDVLADLQGIERTLIARKQREAV